jgi:2-polyprenyl-6-methoxyphenol hydroxylase-like FAD-dependent oxidoreductase
VSAQRPDRVVIIGGSLAGLFAAAACAAAGTAATIVERDRLPAVPASRKGVPQDRQAHVLLHRGLVAAEELLPGLRDDLIRHGGVRFESGTMPWLGEYGWLPTWIPSYEFISTTRPLLEHVARQRVLALGGVSIHDGVRVSELRRSGRGWRIGCADSTVLEADLVIDASGRSSRLPHWLNALGISVPNPRAVDAQLGYACRVYRARGPLPISTGIMVTATPETGTGGLALPVEDGQWLVIATGYGDRRPTRELDEFDHFLADLRDPAVADLVRMLEPVSELAIYRQTGNCRQRYGEFGHWPDGLIAVGDAYCTFNPAFGQGITVAAAQALLVRDALARRDVRPAGRLQRRIGAVADLPWSVVTSEDLRYPSSMGRQNVGQRLLGAWIGELNRLAAHGDRRAYRAFARVYHLVGSPLLFFHPALFVSAARAVLWGRPPAAPRPAVLDALSSALRQGQDAT